MKGKFAPNRIAVYLTSGAALATALAPAVADLDTEDTIALGLGLTGIVATVIKWLDGWQKHEARVNEDVDLDEEDYDGADDGVDNAAPVS